MALREEPAVQLSPEEFRLIRDFIHGWCGIWFHDDARHLVQRRLQPRLEALGLRSFTDYYRRIRYASDRRGELDEIIERVTTNETYFFREMYQLEALRDEILPELHERRPRGRRLTVWSAGCSTGEEAYSVAMLILETGLFADWEVRVFGNDISRRVLQVARRASYGRSSFRVTDERTLRRWFRDDGGTMTVRDDARNLVTFGQLNLLDADMLAILGEVDVCLCRNVLIYFDQAAKKKALSAIHGRLVRGGYLLLGHSESLLNLTTDFQLVHLDKDMVYRKP